MNSILPIGARKKERVRSIRFRLNKTWQSTLDAGRSNEDVPPWFCNIEHVDGPASSRVVRGLRITGDCFDETLILPSGKHTKAVSCGEAFLAWDGDDLLVESTKVEVGRVGRPAGPRVLVRLFTPWLQHRDDDLVLPWRILEETSLNDFVEKQARAFRIIGGSFGLRHDFPHPVGPKMHIACFGSVTWDGDHALIRQQ